LAPLHHEPRGLRHPFDQPEPGREQRFGVETTEQWRVRMRADNLAALAEPLAGIKLGDYDHRILTWMAGWDIPTIAAVASLLHRARAAAPLSTGDTP
jgi:hypothetical protein